ncbi:DUF697 domain-containing protein [Massilia sp. 9096]|uniref:DUF697 domain-containing protein n=1 Tax=Massilia sp. 9096 TaxID=1500894 RepID=UPI000690C3B9|nr:DUF697 domain-containing protein [Massilia sp. 9096]
MFGNKKQQDGALTLLPTAPADIDAVRTRCLALVRKRAALSAGVAAVPLPGIDVVADLTSFASMVEDINRAFGLTPEQIERLQPHMRVAAYEAVGTLGGMLVGKLVTKELVLKMLQKMGTRLAAKSAAKVVPLAGQIAAAAIGFALFRKMGNQHVEACVRVAREVAIKAEPA